MEKETKINQEVEVDETIQEQEEFKIDVDALSETESKSMLKEVLEANDELVKELDLLRKDANKFKDNWYRTTAEYDNFKKRNQDSIKTSFADGKISAIKDMLVIGDSLDRALAVEMDEKTKQGVLLIQKQFAETMKAMGVEEFNPVGEQFSPETAEAIAMVEPVDGETSGTIRTVFKKGYKLNGKMMRYAQVIVVN